MKPTLTLEEFRATRTECPDVRPYFGDDGSEQPMPGYLYAGDGGVICLDKEGEPYLIIYNQQWLKPLADLEVILYEEFYIPEICGGRRP